MRRLGKRPVIADFALRIGVLHDSAEFAPGERVAAVAAPHHLYAQRLGARDDHVHRLGENVVVHKEHLPILFHRGAAP